MAICISSTDYLLQPLIYMWTEYCFPGNSAGSSCNIGDPGSITGSRRSPGGGVEYPFQYSWASPVAHMVKCGLNINCLFVLCSTISYWYCLLTLWQISSLRNFYFYLIKSTNVSHFEFWSFTVQEEKEMTTCSSICAWKIPWIEEPGRLQSMGSQRVGHD